MAKFCADDCQPNRNIFPGDNCEGCGDELAIHDSIASEPAYLAGITFKLYSLRRAKNRHPLYKEPSNEGHEWEFEGPFEMYGELEFPQAANTQSEATEVGQRQAVDAMIKVSRLEIERRESPNPKKGDVVEFWWQEPFEEEKQKRQFDVVSADKDGNIWSTNKHLGQILELKRRGKFLAFRKVEHTKV